MRGLARHQVWILIGQRGVPTSPTCIPLTSSVMRTLLLSHRQLAFICVSIYLSAAPVQSKTTRGGSSLSGAVARSFSSESRWFSSSSRFARCAGSRFDNRIARRRSAASQQRRNRRRVQDHRTTADETRERGNVPRAANLCVELMLRKSFHRF